MQRLPVLDAGLQDVPDHLGLGDLIAPRDRGDPLTHLVRGDHLQGLVIEHVPEVT